MATPASRPNLALFLLSSLLSPLCLPAQTPPQAIVNVNIIDVIRGQVIPAQTVLLANGHIAALGPATAIAIPAGTHRIPGDGRYLIPGLWDMHVHLRSDQAKPAARLIEENAAMLDLFLPNGVTGIREMGGDLSDEVLQWRDQIRAGTRPGPRILTAGRKIDNEPPAWAGSLGVATPDEARQAVRQMKQAGADFIKVYFRRTTSEILRAVVDEAHASRLKVTGHQPLNLSVQEFFDSGIDGMEHSQYLVATNRDDYDRMTRESTAREGKPWSMDNAEMAARLLAMEDAAETTQIHRRMAEKGFWVTPTLTVYDHTLENGAHEYDSDPRKRYIPQPIWATWDPKTSFRRPLPARTLAIREASVKRWDALALAAHKAGVPMLLGTDCGANNDFTFPGFSVHEELAALVRAGFTPGEALRLATINAARWRGEAATEGSVEKDKVADLVLLRSNPLETIRHTQEIDAVFQAGHYFDRPALDAMLARAASAK